MFAPVSLLFKSQELHGSQGVGVVGGDLKQSKESFRNNFLNTEKNRTPSLYEPGNFRETGGGIFTKSRTQFAVSGMLAPGREITSSRNV